MRNIPIDIARGLAIMVVIFWHIVGIHSPWTDGWVMPFFFIVMGLFYRQTLSFKNLLKKKASSILLPHLICSIPAFVISIINTGIYATLKTILNPYCCINPVSWFLISMFFCYLIYWVINHVAKNSTINRILFSFVISVLGFYTSQFHWMGIRLVLPFFISTSLTAILFVEIGRLIAMSKLLNISNISINRGGGIFNHCIIAICTQCLPATSNIGKYDVE